MCFRSNAGGATLGGLPHGGTGGPHASMGPSLPTWLGAGLAAMAAAAAVICDYNQRGGSHAHGGPHAHTHTHTHTLSRSPPPTAYPGPNLVKVAIRTRVSGPRRGLTPCRGVFGRILGAPGRRRSTVGKMSVRSRSGLAGARPVGTVLPRSAGLWLMRGNKPAARLDHSRCNGPIFALALAQRSTKP